MLTDDNGSFAPGRQGQSNGRHRSVQPSSSGALVRSFWSRVRKKPGNFRPQKGTR